MAQLECQLQGDFNKILDALEKKIMGGSMSATKEGSSDYVLNDIRCAVRVYERYSMLGGNRVSLNITLLGIMRVPFYLQLQQEVAKQYYLKLIL